jgi:TDG/mug DNA glycosylase family protein
MPGKVSLAANQYYAHPRNYFWRMMEAVFGVDANLPYEQRCQQLLESRVALWDVLKTCTRSSSLDSDIVSSSIIPNDFQHFLHAHPDIQTIYFNGAKAEQVFCSHVLPTLSDDQALIQLYRLPSTSPANASVGWTQKLQQWQAITR